MQLKDFPNVVVQIHLSALTVSFIVIIVGVYMCMHDVCRGTRVLYNVRVAVRGQFYGAGSLHPLSCEFQALNAGRQTTQQGLSPLIHLTGPNLNSVSMQEDKVPSEEATYSSDVVWGLIL